MKPVTLIKKKNWIITTILIVLSIWLSLILFVIFFVPYKAQAYRDFILNETTGILILQPYKVQKYISKLAPEYTKWIKQIPRFTSLQPGPIRLEGFHNLPREISLLFNHVPNIGNEVYLIVNEKKNSRVFIEEINDSGFIKNLCFAKWDSLRLSPYKSSIWYVKGYFQTVSENRILTSPQFEEKLLSRKHLLEIYWNNSHSNLIGIKETLLLCYKPKGISQYLSCLEYLSQEVLELHLYLDLVEDNLIKGYLSISSVDSSQSIDLCIQQFSEWIRSQLPNDINFEIYLSNAENNRAKWEIVFSQFEPHLRRALGSD